ncbi:hypothetical protein N1851_029048 [Merluccius polli]|uniref:HAT C-terminal dimerisation domain-containing protein n=1 Tax=Merluccius polli TaxID=89951 RepID=A0AA47M7N8_MERPO|nr:hypothetical protein N1851_029048 [Merluccius polli]
MMRIYATIPVSTATVERSFSKLKLVTNSLRSLCKEERLSDLILLSIEKDIPINHNDVINIYRDMAPRSPQRISSRLASLGIIMCLLFLAGLCLVLGWSFSAGYTCTQLLLMLLPRPWLSIFSAVVEVVPEERLSDLILLSIEKDIPINHNDVINIYRDMAPRRVPEPEDEPPRGVEPDDQVYLRVYRRKWTSPGEKDHTKAPMRHHPSSRWKGVPPGTTSTTAQKPLNQGRGRSTWRSWVQVYLALNDHPRTRHSPARNNRHMMMLRLTSLLLILCGLW